MASRPKDPGHGDTAHDDPSFSVHGDLESALDLLRRRGLPEARDLPSELPEQGLGETPTLECLAPHVLGAAAPLDGPAALAHMDPPTPWITWATTLWNARLNQNLLHPATAPFARQAEERVIEWLCPFFGMDGGHMCSGSTLANLTALWAAREIAGIRQIVASSTAHLSIRKAAHILGLQFHEIPAKRGGILDADRLAEALGHQAGKDACLVLTAGTTSIGEIDPLGLVGRAAWTHVDAAWAGPLRLSSRHAALLGGIEQADSISVSAHKWLFQPKDSALVLFRESKKAHEATSFGGGYLAAPNIGVQGSRGAAAIPLLATLLAWGRRGLAERIDRGMGFAAQLATAIKGNPHFTLWSTPVTGITIFRPLGQATRELHGRLPDGLLSTCEIEGMTWLRSVAANPTADIGHILAKLEGAQAR